MSYRSAAGEECADKACEILRAVSEGSKLSRQEALLGAIANALLAIYEQSVHNASLRR